MIGSLDSWSVLASGCRTTTWAGPRPQIRANLYPIDLVELDGQRFLVAPRGRTPWARNAEVAGEVTLKKGRTCLRFPLRPVSDEAKPGILNAYLDRFKTTEPRVIFACRQGRCRMHLGKSAQIIRSSNLFLYTVVSRGCWLPAFPRQTQQQLSRNPISADAAS